MTEPMSVEEMLRSLEDSKIDEPDNGFRTIKDWHEDEKRENGCNTSLHTFRSQIRALVSAGMVETKKFRIKSGQRIYPVPHYRPLK